MELSYVKGGETQHFLIKAGGDPLESFEVRHRWAPVLLSALDIAGQGELQPRGCNAAQSKMFFVMTVGPATNLAVGFPVSAVGRQNETGTHAAFWSPQV